MVVRMEMEQRDGALVSRPRSVGYESVRSRSQREGGALLIGSDCLRIGGDEPEDEPNTRRLSEGIDLGGRYPQVL
jgi:hypothetical protein